MFKKIFTILLLFLTLLGATPVKAGFGISPPYVRSDKLTPGTHFEQKITLLRSSADEDLQATVTVNAPEISDWISIKQGDVFDLPKGKLQVPMIVMVDVPQNATLDQYKGYINIRISPKDDRASGVAIALGARVDIDLTVSNLTIFDFKIRKTEVQNFEELSFPWNMKIFSWFFYRLKVAMTLENLGNLDVAPSKVSVQVTDISKKNTKAELVDKSFDKVGPFETSEIEASFPVNLPAGQYWALIKVYKDNEIMWTDDKTFTISAPGEMGSSAPAFGFWPYLLLALYIFIVLIILAILVKVRSWRMLFPVFTIIFIPFKLLFGLLGSSFSEAKASFWRWIGRKASKYQDHNKKK